MRTWRWPWITGSGQALKKGVESEEGLSQSLEVPASPGWAEKAQPAASMGHSLVLPRSPGSRLRSSQVGREQGGLRGLCSHASSIGRGHRVQSDWNGPRSKWTRRKHGLWVLESSIEKFCCTGGRRRGILGTYRVWGRFGFCALIFVF